MPLTSVIARLYAYRSLVLLLLILAGVCSYLYSAMHRSEAEKQSISTCMPRNRPAAEPR